MKIFYFAEFDCTESTGHAAHVRGVVNAFAQQGHQVTLFAAGWRPDSGSNVRFIRVPIIKRPGFYSLSYTLACIPLLAWWLVRTPPDIGYARFFITLSFLISLFRLWRIPLVVEINADQAVEHVAYHRNQSRRAYWQRQEYRIYSRVAGIVAVAPAIIDSIHRRFAGMTFRSVVIENGVDLDVFRPLDRVECRHSLGLDPSARYIVFVGAFQPWQGLDTLLAAAPGIIAQMPAAMFILAGGSESANRAMSARINTMGMAERFLLPGRVAPGVAAQYIGAGDLCIAPYNQLAAVSSIRDNASPQHMKGSPLKVFTYLACGRLVVASDYLEAGLFVQGIGGGLAFTRGDARALQQAIVSLLQQPELAVRMGSDGAAYVRQHCSWNAVTARIVDFLDVVTSDYRHTTAKVQEPSHDVH